MNWKVRSTNLVSRLSGREKILLAALLLSLVLISYSKVILEPRIQELQLTRDQLARLEKQISKYRGLGYDNPIALVKKQMDYRVKINNLHDRIPGYVGEAEILVDVYNLLQRYGLYAEKITFDKYKAGEGFGKLPVILEIEGYGENAYYFMDNLENHTRLARLSEVEMETKDADLVKCKITVEFYVLGTPGQDPVSYPFMEGNYGKLQPYNLVKLPPGYKQVTGSFNDNRQYGVYNVTSDYNSDAADRENILSGLPEGYLVINK